MSTEHPAHDDKTPESAHIQEHTDTHKTLTKRQAKFIALYTQGKTKGNASASAREAGFSPKSSNSAGARLLKELREQILEAQGRQVDVKREAWHKDKESLIEKLVADLETLEAKHANKPKYYDQLMKLRGFTEVGNGGTLNLISVAVKGDLLSFAQELAKQVVDVEGMEVKETEALNPEGIKSIQNRPPNGQNGHKNGQNRPPSHSTDPILKNDDNPGE